MEQTRSTEFTDILKRKSFRKTELENHETEAGQLAVLCKDRKGNYGDAHKRKLYLFVTRRASGSLRVWQSEKVESKGRTAAQHPCR